ncbi:MAG: pseudouridine synthase [Campylobacterales bacterium]
MRLNKYLSHNTKLSRREADRAIQEGRVNIDRVKITNPATQVEDEQKVFLDSRFINPNRDEMITVIAYCKPKGEIVSKKDDRGRKTIYDTLPDRFRGFVPVGRLDFTTTGLLLLTDSKPTAARLMESNLERVYIVKLKGSITEKIEKAMLEGLHNVDAKKGGHKLSDIETMSFAPFLGYKIDKNTPNHSKLKIAISEGKNREIRRFFGYFDRDVIDLKRVSFGGVELNALPEGKWRFLNKKEYKDLREFLNKPQANMQDN